MKNKKRNLILLTLLDVFLLMLIMMIVLIKYEAVGITNFSKKSLKQKQSYYYTKSSFINPTHSQKQLSLVTLDGKIAQIGNMPFPKLALRAITGVTYVIKNDEILTKSQFASEIFNEKTIRVEGYVTTYPSGSLSGDDHYIDIKKFELLNP